MTPYERLYDICEANGYELEILIYEYAKKRVVGGYYDPGRIALRVTTRDEDGERVALGAWGQPSGKNQPSIDDLAIMGLNYLDKKKYIS